MATLESHKAGSRNFRLVTTFAARRPAFGYNGQKLSFRFDHDQDDKNSDGRNWRLLFRQEEIDQLLDYLLNPAYTVGFFAGTSLQSDNRLAPALSRQGIEFYRYRHPNVKLNDWAYVEAVNIHHAITQFRKMEGFMGTQIFRDKIQVRTEDCQWIKPGDRA